MGTNNTNDGTQVPLRLFFEPEWTGDMQRRPVAVL